MSTRPFTVSVALLLVATALFGATPLLAQDTVAAPSAAPRARVRPEVMRRVEHALLAIDSDVPPSFWAELGPEGLAALAVILDDGTRPVGLRRHAVSALAHHQGPVVLALLDALARSPREDEIVSRNAVLVAATRARSEALPVIDAALRDPRALVREGAVIALSRLHARGGLDQAVLHQRLTEAREREHERFVVLAIDRVLGGGRP